MTGIYSLLYYLFLFIGCFVLNRNCFSIYLVAKYIGFITKSIAERIQTFTNNIYSPIQKQHAMDINMNTPMFRFATLRSPKPAEPPVLPGTIFDVLPATAFVESLISVNESSNSDTQKSASVNSILQAFISGSDFIKTALDFSARVDVNSPGDKAVNLMYDNVIARLLTKSNTNEVYGLLTKYIKKFAASLNGVEEKNVRILIPERLTFNFIEFAGTNTPTPPSNEQQVLLENMALMQAAQKKIAEAKDQNIITLVNGKQAIRIVKDYSGLLQSLGVNQISVAEAEAQLRARLADADKRLRADRQYPQTDDTFAGKTNLRTVEANNMYEAKSDYDSVSGSLSVVLKAKAQGLTILQDTEQVDGSNYAQILTALKEKGPVSIDSAEKKVNDALGSLFSNVNKVLPGTNYMLVAGSWKQVGGQLNEPLIDTDSSSILVYSHGCYLKYPVQVADLRIIEQQTVGYLPAEIAHINNTQRGEKNTRVTRRLKSVETTETIINESEVTHETDSQSTEKFGLESSAYDVQQQENSFNINGTVSYTMGPWSASVSGGYSSSSLSLSGNSSAQSYAKEVFTRIVDRASSRIRTERSVKTIEEFEETVTHVIDNTNEATKSYVYRWLNKLVRGTLKNYGKRLIFQVDVAHPSHYYLYRIKKEGDAGVPVVNLPTDPRTLTIGGNPFGPAMIDANNYISLGNQYQVKLDAPPTTSIIVSEVFSGNSNPTWVNKLLTIKAGYQCKRAVITNMYLNGWPGGNAIAFMVGTSVQAHWSGGDDFWVPVTLWLNNETDNLPINIFNWRQGYMFNIEVHCDLTPQAMLEWQQKAYYDIIDGYEKLKAAAEAKINGFDPNAPGLPPEKKLALIKSELKRESIRKMYRCNPFWVNDKYEIFKEYDPDCCNDGANAERARFLETVFDWQNMTYELHPYFYADKHNWEKQLNLTDDDPHFEAFLQASYATVHIPVFRDNLKEIAACNFIINNAIGNFETIPTGLIGLLDELANEPASLFTYDLDGNELPVPKSTVDLGVFPVPTSLVILECGTQDGVKPIGFPETTVGTTDVSIPKQYSPAIISDNCNP